MQKSIFIISLLLLSICLSACNLGANAVQEPTEVIQQPTSIIIERTEEPTQLATVTRLPTLQPVSNNNTSTGNTNTNTCSPRTDWASYTVVAGDTLSRIAVRGSTTLNTLITGNCLANPNVITPGQVLRVPNPVSAVTPVVVTSTSVPQSNNSCRITMTAQRLAYSDQTYLSVTRLLNAGETYVITGHNFWNYRIQLSSNLEGWLQKNIPETTVGNCGIVPELGLSYQLQGVTRTDICYFIPHSNNFTAYDDMAQTTGAFTLAGNQYYFVDARAGNAYRLVAGENLPYPVWASMNNAGIEGNCTTLPDFSVSTTLNGASATFSPNDYPLTFNYPANWVLTPLTDSMGGYLTGTMPLHSSYPGAKGLPSDIVGVSVMRLENPLGQSAQGFAEAVVADIRANASRVSVLQDPTAITMQTGLAGYHFILSLQGAQLEQYIFEINGQLYMLSIQGNQSHAARIVETIRTR